jgi:hypothetical protein
MCNSAEPGEKTKEFHAARDRQFKETGTLFTPKEQEGLRKLTDLLKTPAPKK